jgi:hypothetical protein
MSQLTIQKLRDVITHGYIEQEFTDAHFYEYESELDEINDIKKPTKGVLIDVLTASMLIKVYDALNDANKIKFERMLLTFNNFEKLIEFGWKQVK